MKEPDTPLDTAQDQLKSLIHAIAFTLSKQWPPNEEDLEKLKEEWGVEEDIISECVQCNQDELVLALRETICELSLTCSMDSFCGVLIGITSRGDEQEEVLVLQALNRFLEFREGFGCETDEEASRVNLEQMAAFVYGKADSGSAAMHEICVKALRQLSFFCLDKLNDMLCSELKSTGYWNRGEGVLKKLVAVQAWEFSRGEIRTVVAFLEHVCATLKRAVSKDLVDEVTICCESVLKKLALSDMMNGSSRDENRKALQPVLDALAVQADRSYQKRKQPIFVNLLLAVVMMNDNSAFESEGMQTLRRAIYERVVSDETRLSGLDHLRRFLEALPCPLDEVQRPQFAALVKGFLDELLVNRTGEVPGAQEGSVLASVIAAIGKRDPESALCHVIETVLNRPIALNPFSSAQRSIALRSLGMIAHDISETFPVKPYERYVETYLGRSIPSAEVKEAMSCFPFLCVDSSRALGRIVDSAFGFEAILVAEAREALKRLMNSNYALYRDRAIQAFIDSKAMQLSSVSAPAPEVAYLIACMDTVRYVFEGYAWSCDLRIDLGACCMLKLTHPSKTVRLKCRKLLEMLGFKPAPQWDTELLDACHQRLLTSLSCDISRCGIKVVIRERDLLSKSGVLADENDPLHWWVYQAHSICSHTGQNWKKEGFIKSLLRIALFADPFTASAASRALGGLSESFELVKDNLPIITPNDFAINKSSSFYNENIIDLLATLPQDVSSGLADYRASFAKEWVNAVTSNSSAALSVMEQWGKSTFRSASIVLASLGKVCTREEEIDYRSTAVTILCSIWFKRSRSREICRSLVSLLSAGSLSKEETTSGHPNPVSSALFTLWHYHERETELVQTGLVALLRANPTLTNLYLHYAFGICHIEQDSLTDQSIKAMFVPVQEFDFRDYSETAAWDSSSARFANSITFSLLECAKEEASQSLRPDLFCLLLYQLSHIDESIRIHAAKMASALLSAETVRSGTEEMVRKPHVLEVKRNGVSTALAFAEQIAVSRQAVDSVEVLHVASGVLIHTNTASANRVLAALRPLMHPIEDTTFNKAVYNALLRISQAHVHEPSFSWKPWAVLAEAAQEELIESLLEDLCKSDMKRHSTKRLFKCIFREIAAVDQLREVPTLITLLAKALPRVGDAPSSTSFIAPWCLTQVGCSLFLQTADEQLHRPFARLGFEALIIRDEGPEPLVEPMFEELTTALVMLNKEQMEIPEQATLACAFVKTVAALSKAAGHELLKLCLDYLERSPDNPRRGYVLVVLEDAKLKLTDGVGQLPFGRFVRLASQQMIDDESIGLTTSIDTLKFLLELVADSGAEILDMDACYCVELAVHVLQTAIQATPHTIPVLRATAEMLACLLRNRPETVETVLKRLQDGVPNDGFICALCNLELYFDVMPIIQSIRRENNQPYTRLIVLVSYLISLSNHDWVEANLSRFMTALERWRFEEESKEDGLIRIVLARLVHRLKGSGHGEEEEQVCERGAAVAQFLEEYRQVSTRSDTDKEVVEAIATMVRVNGPILFEPIYEVFCELVKEESGVIYTPGFVDSCRLLLHYAIKYKLAEKHCLNSLANVCRRQTTLPWPSPFSHRMTGVKAQNAKLSRIGAQLASSLQDVQNAKITADESQT